MLPLLLVLAAQAGAESGAEARHPARATAYAVKVLLPNQEPIVAASVGGPSGLRATPVPFAYPEDGSIVRAETVAGRSTAATSSAQARADLRMVSLFGGEITVEAVVARSTASSARTTRQERFDATSITKLTVLGEPIEPAADLRVPLGDWGHLTLLQERTRAIGAASRRGWVTVLDVRLDADHAALPVERASSSATPRRRPRAARPPPPAALAPAAKPAVSPAPAAVSVPTPLPRIRRGLGIPARCSAAGYLRSVPARPHCSERHQAAHGAWLRLSRVWAIGVRRQLRRSSCGHDLASRRRHLRGAGRSAARGCRRHAVFGGRNELGGTGSGYATVAATSSATRTCPHFRLSPSTAGM